MRLDAGYDSKVTRALLADLGLGGCIAVKGVKASAQLSKRWVVERTFAWLNGYSRLRRLTDRDHGVIELHTHLVDAITVIRRLINKSHHRYRCPAELTTRRLR